MKINALFIFVVLFPIYSLFWNIVRFVYFFKCIKVQACSDSSCRNKNYCDKYGSKLTDEEAEELLKLLEQYEKH